MTTYEAKHKKAFTDLVCELDWSVNEVTYQHIAELVQRDLAGVASGAEWALTNRAELDAVMALPAFYKPEAAEVYVKKIHAMCMQAGVHVPWGPQATAVLL